MQNIIRPPIALPSFRLAGFILLAAFITFALFVVMQKLIAQDGGTYVSPTEAVFVDPVLNVEEPETREKPTMKEFEQPKKMPKQIRPKIAATPNNQVPIDVNIPGPGIKVAKTKQVFSLDDGESRPIFRMSPKYPPEAAQKGLEGWVELQFTIDASGAVKDIKVTDAQPKRIFDKEARRALKKWKYKPLVVEGQPTDQPNRMVVLDFKLES